ncbi:MAG: aldehyde dehydrogenase family protein [Hyphomicrobiales bacterium]|nr:MAG: aldehyde dehydrogenase family protein [Hyphomicrobiales bacterium]
MYKLDKHYIGGRWVPAHGTDAHAMVNPSTEEVIGTVVLGDQQDVDTAVAAARAAFPAWSESPVADRIRLVEKIRDEYRRRLPEMGAAISTEMGAPIDMAIERQAPAVANHATNFLRVMETFSFSQPFAEHAPNDRILLQPIGVVGMISPWNWPMSQVGLKVIPAILAGCTMVLKPSEYAALSSNLLAEIFHDVGVPAGVFNLVHGDGPGAGARLSAHPDVAMMSFTGSTTAGRLVMKSAADTFKRVALELGGKGANLIFDDADADAVARGVRQCFSNSGQSCNAPTRMLVQRSIYADAVERAREQAEATAVGRSDAPGTHIGPVVSARQYERVQALIESGIREGARLVAGGPGRPSGFNNGYFVQPTIFADVTPQMTIAREEIFGPVLSIIPFEDESHALEIANDTPYGLTNYVQTADVERRRRLASRLHAGMIEMNGQPRGAGAPFGGVGFSGGGREGGKWGLEEYLTVKSVSAWN